MPSASRAPSGRRYNQNQNDFKKTLGMTFAICRRYRDRVDRWVEADPSRLWLRFGEADEESLNVMAPLVDEMYQDWMEKSEPREHDPQAHRDAWISLIRLEIRALRDKLRKRERTVETDWIEHDGNDAPRDPEASYAPTETSAASSSASSPLLVGTPPPVRLGNTARPRASLQPLFGSQGRRSAPTQDGGPTAAAMAGVEGRTSSIDTFPIFCYRATDASPRWAMMAEVRDFQDNVQGVGGLPPLSFGRFYRMLEDGFHPANTEGVRWHDQQNGGVVDVLRPRDFEDAVRRAFRSGASSVVFEIYPLEAS